MIRVLPKLLAKYSDLEFVFVGRCNHSDSSQQHIYNRLITFASNNENVKLLSEISYSSLISLISTARLLINPSLFEGWSTTVMEAICCQVPLLLSNINVHTQQTADYPYSYLFDVKSDQSFFDGFEHLISLDHKYSSSLYQSSLSNYIEFGRRMYEIYYTNV